MAGKKKSSKKHRPAPSLPPSHLLVIGAFAALVCLLPWPGGWGSGAFWIRAGIGLAASLLFYLLVRWILRDSYPAFLAALMLLCATAVWMPFGAGWRPWVLLFLLSFALGALFGYWDRKLGGRKVGFQHLLFAGVAGSIALAAVGLSLLVLLRPMRYGAVPMLSALLMAAVAVGVVLMAVSAFSRRRPWDIVLGAVLYAVVWKLLSFPGFESFL